MTRGYVLTPEAEANVDEILEFVESRFGALVADRVYADFLAAFRLLASSPKIGRARPEFWPEPYLFWRCGPSLISYRADVNPIQIIAVSRASRDWTRTRPS